MYECFLFACTCVWMCLLVCKRVLAKTCQKLCVFNCVCACYVCVWRASVRLFAWGRVSLFISFSVCICKGLNEAKFVDFWLGEYLLIFIFRVYFCMFVCVVLARAYDCLVLFVFACVKNRIGIWACPASGSQLQTFTMEFNNGKAQSFTADDILLNELWYCELQQLWLNTFRDIRLNEVKIWYS